MEVNIWIIHLYKKSYLHEIAINIYGQSFLNLKKDVIGFILPSMNSFLLRGP